MIKTVPPCCPPQVPQVQRRTTNVVTAKELLASRNEKTVRSPGRRRLDGTSPSQEAPSSISTTCLTDALATSRSLHSDAKAVEEKEVRRNISEHEQFLQSVDAETLTLLRSKCRFDALVMTPATSKGIDFAVTMLYSMAEKEKNQERFSFALPSGQHKSFHYNSSSGLFCQLSRDGILTIIINHYLAEQWNVSLVSPKRNNWSDETWHLEHEAAATGNHRSRPQRVRVPTAAGQTVRH